MPRRKWPKAEGENPHTDVHSDGPEDECAYRRGFEHGMTAVLHLPWVSISRPKRAQKWISAVWKWRSMTTHKYRIPPPVPKLTEEEEIEAARWWKARGRPWMY